MSMTREEAVELLCYGDWLNVISEHIGKQDTERIAKAMCIVGKALRPVSRERVEKVLRGEWGRYCFSDDSHGYQCKNCGVQLDDPVYYRSFCPKCGKAMTDEAVEMVMERLEALEDG